MILMTIMLLAAVLILAIISASFYFYSIAIARTDKSFLNGNPDLKAGGNTDNPFRIAEDWWHKQTFSEWSLVSGDGLKLHAYYLAAPVRTDKTVILAHGYCGQAAQMGALAQMYREALGFNVLVPDARGHGKSEGAYIGFGWPERKDYVRWIDRLMMETGKDAQIVLHGVSMGGATVMMTGGEKLPLSVKAIVEDCGYTSVAAQLAYQLKRMYRLPPFPLIQATSLLTKIRAGYFFGEASALKQVQKTKLPMLFIHGGADAFVPTEMVYELFENGPRHKQLFIVPEAGHGMARRVDREGYDREVAGFVSRYVK